MSTPLKKPSMSTHRRFIMPITPAMQNQSNPLQTSNSINRIAHLQTESTTDYHHQMNSSITQQDRMNTLKTIRQKHNPSPSLGYSTITLPKLPFSQPIDGTNLRNLKSMHPTTSYLQTESYRNNNNNNNNISSSNFASTQNYSSQNIINNNANNSYSNNPNQSNHASNLRSPSDSDLSSIKSNYLRAIVSNQSYSSSSNPNNSNTNQNSNLNSNNNNNNNSIDRSNTSTRLAADSKLKSKQADYFSTFSSSSAQNLPKRISTLNMSSDSSSSSSQSLMSFAEKAKPSQVAATQNFADPLQMLDEKQIPKIDTSKVSTAPIGFIQAYAANTHQGLSRPYNEDRVSIILNMVKPQDKDYEGAWPNISYFAIYDGHGGAQCADFLRDQLHFFIIKDTSFPANPDRAIHNGFIKAEAAFLKIAESCRPLDRSGSCAIVIMFINERIFVANLGDSRAVISKNQGRTVVSLSIDHKPNLPSEEQRIINNGGKIYQTSIPVQLSLNSPPQIIKGPFRAMPGRLAVSRTIGDAEAKIRKYGGNPRVVIAEPEISSFTLSSEQDFILLGCDGIFDKLSSEETIGFLWTSIRQNTSSHSLHQTLGASAEYLLKQTMMHKSFDNLTVVIISLKTLDQLHRS